MSADDVSTGLDGGPGVEGGWVILRHYIAPRGGWALDPNPFQAFMIQGFNAPSSSASRDGVHLISPLSPPGGGMHRGRIEELKRAEKEAAQRVLDAARA